MKISFIFDAIRELYRSFLYEKDFYQADSGAIPPPSPPPPGTSSPPEIMLPCPSERYYQPVAYDITPYGESYVVLSGQALAMWAFEAVKHARTQLHPAIIMPNEVSDIRARPVGYRFNFYLNLRMEYANTQLDTESIKVILQYSLNNLGRDYRLPYQWSGFFYRNGIPVLYVDYVFQNRLDLEVSCLFILDEFEAHYLKAYLQQPSIVDGLPEGPLLDPEL